MGPVGSSQSGFTGHLRGVFSRNSTPKLRSLEQSKRTIQSKTLSDHPSNSGREIRNFTEALQEEISRPSRTADEKRQLLETANSVIDERLDRVYRILSDRRYQEEPTTYTRDLLNNWAEKLTDLKYRNNQQIEEFQPSEPGESHLEPNQEEE
jgi:exonuclease VII large subunit